MKIFRLLPILFLFSVSALFSQKNVETNLYQLFQDRYEKEQTGASILVAKEGSIIFQQQYGLANIECNIPVTANTKFLIGSITKQFTAAAILLLQEQGKLLTSDYLDQYLPEFDRISYPITIKHLLTHVSGLPSDNAAKEISRNLRYNISPQERIKFIENEPLLFPPATAFDYSNNGYIVLGLIIEKVSGKTYSEFLEQHVFEPFKMYDTQIADHREIVKNRASGYATDEQENIINATYHASSFSAGGIVSTPSDLHTWVTALFARKLISQKSISEMIQNFELKDGTKLNLGYGWEINEIGKNISYEHSGFEPGYKCYAVYLPEEKIYTIVLQNSEVGTPSTTAIQATAIVSRKPYPTSNQIVALAKAQLQSFIGTYALKGGKECIISEKDGALFYNVLGSVKRKVFPIDERTLIFGNGYRQFKFENLTDKGYEKITFANRIHETEGIKTSTIVPPDHIAITLSTTIMNRYIGIYEAEQFTMTISMEDGNLYAQPEGSDKLPLTAKAENQFFIEAIGAEIEFISEIMDGKKVEVIYIILEGERMKGLKKL